MPDDAPDGLRDEMKAQLRRLLDQHARPGVPKYVAMRDAVVDAVTGGNWPAGTRLPTEIEWTADLPLSLGTVQRALRMLVDDGVIVRRQGHGTFVAERADGRMHAPLHCRFVDHSGRAYLPVFADVVSRNEVSESGPWSAHLGAASVLCIERVLRIGDEFNVFSRFYADPKRLPAFAKLPAKKLSGENFKDLILRESAQPIGRISQFLTSIKLPAEVCDAIGVRRATVGQQLQVFAFVGRQSPIYYQDLFIPPNTRTLHLASDGRDPGFDATRAG